MKVPDVNVLLYARNESASGHEASKAWLESALRGDESVGLAWIALIGFVRIATNPRSHPTPIAISDALDQIDAWLAAPQSVPLNPSGEHARILRELLEQSGTAGNLTTDAHLAGLAIENGATLASFDGDFHRFDKLKLEHLRA